VSGQVQCNSGGTKFGGGDVHTKHFFIEAKAVKTPHKSVTIQKEWIHKAKEQSFEQGKPYSALAVCFDPAGPDYFVINEDLFSVLVKYLEGISE
jgi:hypothetical protein